MEERNYFAELREKLTEAGVSESKIIELQNWLNKALMEKYQKGSDDAAKIYNPKLKEE